MFKVSFQLSISVDLYSINPDCDSVFRLNPLLRSIYIPQKEMPIQGATHQLSTTWLCQGSSLQILTVLQSLTRTYKILPPCFFSAVLPTVSALDVCLPFSPNANYKSTNCKLPLTGLYLQLPALASFGDACTNERCIHDPKLIRVHRNHMKPPMFSF